MGSWLRIRDGEGRDAWGGFLGFFGLMTAHMLLETARDAIFLTRLPAWHLAGVYLAIAAVAVGLTYVQSRLSSSLTDCRSLFVALMVASGVTLAFWPAVAGGGTTSAYALYIWSGMMASLVAVQIWTVLGERFVASQAKRLYGFIGGGSVLGAIAGSALAAGLVQVISPTALLPVAAGILAIAGVFVPWLLHPNDAANTTSEIREPEPPTAPKDPSLSGRDRMQIVMKRPYVRLLAALGAASAVTLTLADYLFKSTVAATVAPEDLATTLATFYLVVNSGSLLVQLGLVGPIMRTMGADRAIALLPLVIGFGSVGLFVGAGLMGALAIKGADGSLRHTVQRTASELLYLPMADEIRRRVKGFIDVGVYRTGQAVASATILGAAWFGLGDRTVAVLTALAAVAWVGVAVRMRKPYLSLFRARLGRRETDFHNALPEVDLQSLETLLTSLNSNNDKEVLAAIQILETQGRANLIPVLILYHPSTEVVLAALNVFLRVQRHDWLTVGMRLWQDADPEIRAAIVRTCSIQEPMQRALDLARQDESVRVRVVGWVFSVADVMATVEGGEPVSEEQLQAGLQALEDCARNGTNEEKLEALQSILEVPSPRFVPVLRIFAEADDDAIGSWVARCFGAIGDPALISDLIGLLLRRGARSAARDALVKLGEPAQDALLEAFVDTNAPRALRLQIPNALVEMNCHRSTTALLEALLEEPDGMLRFRSLRALGRIVADNPEARPDRELVERVMATSLAKGFELIHWRDVLETEAQRRPEIRTEGYQLMHRLLDDKLTHSIERTFRLIGLIHDGEDYQRIYRAARTGSKVLLASSQELIEHALRGTLRDAVIGLIDDAPARERLAAGAHFYKPPRLDYAGLLTRLADDSRRVVREIAEFHAVETNIDLAALRAERAQEANRRSITRTLPLAGWVLGGAGATGKGSS